MKKLPIVVAVLWFSALAPRAALSVTESHSNANLAYQTLGSPIQEQYIEDNSSGLTSSADIVGSTPGTLGSWAHAFSSPGTVGAKAQLAPTVGAAESAWAGAVTKDDWQMIGSPSASFVPMETHLRFSGTLDPWLLDPSLPRPAGLLQMVVQYEYGVGNPGNTFGVSFRFRIAYPSTPFDVPIIFVTDTGLPGGWSRTDYPLTFSGNMVTFDQVLNWSLPAGSWRETMGVGVSIWGDLDNPGGSPHTIDFYQTFSTQVFSNDPNVQFVSDGGRTAVPEPAGLILLMPALALAALRARWGPAAASPLS